MTADKIWQRNTALRNIALERTRLERIRAPVNDRILSEFGPKYVGAKVSVVLSWMKAVQV